MAAIVSWSDVTVSVPARKKQSARTILSAVSGYASAGTAPEGGLAAIMGPSGSGKSTLLGVLAGRTVPDKGELFLGGQRYGASNSDGTGAFVPSAHVGFVPQTDQLFSTLTVLETLKLYSTLRGARRSVRAPDATADDARIHALLSELGLTDVADTPIGEAGATSGRRRGVSGGERKRVSIALELLHAPPLLVLDEPTSGLDSSAAVGVLHALRTLTKQQAVVLSLHQPSARAFKLVSQLGLLTPGGGCAYFGPAHEAVTHFATIGAPVPPLTNPAEHYLDAVSDGAVAPSHAHASSAQLGAVLARQQSLTAAAPVANGRGPSRMFQQGVALLWRAQVHNRRHPAFGRALLSRSVTMSLVVGYLYSGLRDDQASVQDRVGALYFVLTNQIMCSSASMRTFLVERDIAQHELAAALYPLPAYFVARSLAESIWQLAGSALFGVLTYALVGFAPTIPQLVFFVGTICLVTLCAESYVVLVGALMPDDKSAAVVSPLVLALFMVSGGLFVNAASVPPLFHALNRLSMFSYGFSALLQNEMRGLRLVCEPHELVGPPPPRTLAQKAVAAAVGDAWPAQVCPIESGEHVVERMAMGGLTPEQNVLALVVLLVAFRMLAYLALRRRFALV